MHNLRVMHFNRLGSFDSNVIFHSFCKSFPDELKYLHWIGFPKRSLPLEFCPENLVSLSMPYSHLVQLWDEDKALPNLKRLNLRSSEKLIRVPDLSLSPNIEEIILSDCVSLEKIDFSKFLDNLNCLCLDGCTALGSLVIQCNILWRPYGLVALHGCRNLETLLISSTADVVQSSSWYCGFHSDYQTISVFDDETVITLDASGTSIMELCWLDASNCESLTCLPAELYLNLKFLRILGFSGCSKLKELPEIKESMENLTVLNLDKTSIKELPSSMHHLVGLEELSLRCCKKLKSIPSSIGNLSKLVKLDLAYCESLETFPEFEVTMKNLKVLILDGTAIIELLPSSLHHLVGLEELSLRCCKKLKTIPPSIGNLCKLFKLDLAGCESLEIVNLLEVESMADLSNLKSLDLSDCKCFECIPMLPPNLNELKAYDCPSIKRVVQNSRSKLLSDSEKGIFKFHLTNCQELDAYFLSNIQFEAWVKITDNAYWSVFFCFPGSQIPCWFPYCCQGHSVTMKKDSSSLYGKNRFNSVALCVVLGREDMDDTSARYKGLTYKLSFESDGQPRDFYCWVRRFADLEFESRFINQDHTFLWKYRFNLASIGNELYHANSFTFEILDEDLHPLSTAKECGMCPLDSNITGIW